MLVSFPQLQVDLTVAFPFLLGRPWLSRETGFPGFSILSAKMLAASGFFFTSPPRDVSVKNGLFEAITMQRAFHGCCNWFLCWITKERLFILREADAIGREHALCFCRFFARSIVTFELTCRFQVRVRWDDSQ